MKKSLSVGLIVGILSGIGGIITASILEVSTGLSFDQLTWVSIGLAAVVCNVVGALIFTKWFRKRARARLYYALLVTCVTLLMTLNDIANPPAKDFGLVAHPLHIVVALLSIWLIPKWLKKEGSETIQTTSGKSSADPFH